MTTPTIPGAVELPDYAPIPASAFGPSPNEQGYYVGRVGPERDRLYAQHASIFPGFLAYPGQTSRVIPVLVLERI